MKQRPKQVTIYFDAEKTSMKVLKPSEEKFDKDWHRLVEGVTNGLYHNYILS